jgi:hypothetical protein
MKGNDGPAGRPGEAGKNGRKGPKGIFVNIYGYNAKTPCNHMVNAWHPIYLDRHNLSCKRWGNEFLAGWKMQTGHCHHGSQARFTYTCVSPAKWRKCADEGGTCHCKGMVRYGKDGFFTYGRRSNGNLHCARHSFPHHIDPIPGQKKYCECASNGHRGSGMSRCTGYRYTSCQHYGNSIAYLDRQRVSCPGHMGLTEAQATHHGCHHGQMRYRYQCCQPAKGFTGCRHRYTQCDWFGHRPMQYLDRHHVFCHYPNEVLTGWNVGTWWCGWGNNRMRVQYRCCSINHLRWD